MISTLRAATCTRMGNGTHAPPRRMVVTSAVALSYVRLVLPKVVRLNIDLEWCIMSCRACACEELPVALARMAPRVDWWAVAWSYMSRWGWGCVMDTKAPR